MIELSPDSDCEGVRSDTLHSSQSSISSGSCCDRCSSFSRLSFDAAVPPPNLSTKPHRSSDAAWTAIRSRSGSLPLGPRDFNLLRRIGSGDIGTVYLCRLRNHTAGDHSSFTYAMKIVDKQSLAKKNKLGRADAERRVLRILDHPFLPTLFADFDASPHFSCVVTEFCAGGDLHSLLHRQPRRRLSLPAARFYAAEVLLALEYLHMLGIVYRDLKPENILIRSDGHIMLSDFDLSLESFAAPAVEIVDVVAAGAGDSLSCLPDRLFRPKKAAGGGSGSAPLSRRFVAEPVEARSNSFVGTHEYVSPEVAGGGAHGNAVDWWAYGVFLYELVYGRTPFAGPTNAATLRNILKQPLEFPKTADSGEDTAAVNDLISLLLVKDPSARLGSRRGAADVKMHRFFRGLNLALLRSCKPPLVPASGGPGLARLDSGKGLRKSARFDYF